MTNPLNPDNWTEWAVKLFDKLLLGFFVAIGTFFFDMTRAILAAVGGNTDSLLLPLPAAMTYAQGA